MSSLLKVEVEFSSVLSEEDVVLNLARSLRVNVLGVRQDLVFPGLSISIGWSIPIGQMTTHNTPRTRVHTEAESRGHTEGCQGQARLSAL